MVKSTKMEEEEYLVVKHLCLQSLVCFGFFKKGLKVVNEYVTFEYMYVTRSDLILDCLGIL